MSDRTDTERIHIRQIARYLALVHLTTSLIKQKWVNPEELVNEAVTLLDEIETRIHIIRMNEEAAGDE